MTPEEEDKKKLIDRFFDHGWEYNHCSLLFNFVYSGFFNREELKNEIDPEPKELNPFQIYLRSFNDMHFFFRNDAFIEQKIKEGEDLIMKGDNSLTAAELISTISHVKICHKFLGQKISKNINDRVLELTKDLATRGDETFQDKFQMSPYHEYFKDYVDTYEENLPRGQIVNKSSEIREMIKNNQENELLEFIERRADNLKAFCDQILGNNVVELYFTNREWGYGLITKAALHPPMSGNIAV